MGPSLLVTRSFEGGYTCYPVSTEIHKDMHNEFLAIQKSAKQYNNNGWPQHLEEQIRADFIGCHKSSIKTIFLYI